MAVDSNDPTTGRPIFSDTGAPDIGVDPTAVGIYAAEVGNRIVKADLAALNAYAYKRSGLAGHALNTKTDYVHDGSGWKLWHRAPATYTPTLTSITGTPTVVARYAIAAGTVNASVQITLTGATLGTAPMVSLPVAAQSAANKPIIGFAQYSDVSPGGYYFGIVKLESTTNVALMNAQVTGSAIGAAVYVGAGSPFTWAAGDIININFSYEAA